MDDRIRYIYRVFLMFKRKLATHDVACPYLNKKVGNIDIYYEFKSYHNGDYNWRLLYSLSDPIDSWYKIYSDPNMPWIKASVKK